MRKITIASVIAALCVMVCGNAIADDGVSVLPKIISGRAGDHVEIAISCDFEPASIVAEPGGIHILGGPYPYLGGPEPIPVLGLHPLALSTLRLKIEPLSGRPLTDGPNPLFIKGRVYGRKVQAGSPKEFYLKTPAGTYDLVQAKDYIGKPISSYIGKAVGVYSCDYHGFARRPIIYVNAITPYDAARQDYIGILRGMMEGPPRILPDKNTGTGVGEWWFLENKSGSLGLFKPDNFNSVIAETMKENVNKRVNINGPVYKDAKRQQLLLMSIRPEPYKTSIVIGLTDDVIAVQELLLRVTDKEGSVHEVRIPVEISK